MIINAEDTDVLVLAAYVANSGGSTLAIKCKQNIINCQTLCPEGMADLIVPMHVYSSCDTTASFFSHGKTAIYDKVLPSEAKSLLQSIGKWLLDTQDALDAMATFTIQFVYKNKTSKSLGDEHARKWKHTKNKSPLRLLPERDSYDLKSEVCPLSNIPASKL